MFSVSTKAVEEIKKLLAEENTPESVLRVRVVPGGCSGFSYEMGFDDEMEKSDEIIEEDGVRVAIDELSYPYIEGGVLDYNNGLNGTGFSISNPNATGTCCCGTSFTA